MTQQFRAINIIDKATTKEVFTCIKMDVNKFVVDPEMTVEKNSEEIISNYIIKNDTSTRTKEQRRKLSEKKLQHVKKEREGMEIEALKRA